MKMSWNTENGRLVARWSETEKTAYDASWLLSMNEAPVAAREVVLTQGASPFSQVLAADLAAVIGTVAKTGSASDSVKRSRHRVESLQIASIS